MEDDPYFAKAESDFYARRVPERMAKVIRVIRHQTGKTNIPVDRTIRAMKAGKRISKTGHIYWETRKNRSDVIPKKKI